MAKKQGVNEHGFFVDENGQVLTDDNGQPQRAEGTNEGTQQSVEGGDLANVGAGDTEVEGAPVGQGQPVQGGETSKQEVSVSKEDQDSYLRKLGILGSDDQSDSDPQ